MVQAACTPESHIGDFDFPCSNEYCQNGPNQTRSVLCEFCSFKDYFYRTLLHCYTCHSSFQEEDKKDDSDSDDDNEGWLKMTKKEIKV